MEKDKIYLVGFMGAGKSTLANALGVQLGWRVEDIDTRVERRERLTVSEIFARRGEPRFRAVERAVLTDLLPARYTVDRDRRRHLRRCRQSRLDQSRRYLDLA